MPSQPVVHPKPLCVALSPSLCWPSNGPHWLHLCPLAVNSGNGCSDALVCQGCDIHTSKPNHLQRIETLGTSRPFPTLSRPLCELCRTSTGWRLVRAAYSLISVFTDEFIMMRRTTPLVGTVGLAPTRISSRARPSRLLFRHDTHRGGCLYWVIHSTSDPDLT